jgi:peptidoglycan/xylan/chitin deacetylase (PgdA/CDA1 family)
METKICITVDTEFSIAGAFADPSLRPIAEPFVWCDVGGRSEGLGFLLECFRKYRIPATFFVEALHRQYFHNDPMGPIARRIHGEGHEVQLHVHPCWSVFKYSDWPERVRQHPRQDDFYGRTEDDSIVLIRQGLEIFNDWGLQSPQVFRSGSLQHDDALYRALARTGIPYSSNIGLAIFDNGEPQYQLYAGCHDRHGVLECPILTFSDWRFAGRRHLKSLTIAGTSFAETRTLLEQAHKLGIPLVVILTHPFEYIQSRDVGLQHARRHSVNQQRLTKLCQFLNDNRDRFSPTGFAEAASSSVPRGSPQNPLLEGGLWQSLTRMATQVSYDRFGHWALACTKGPVQ